MIGQSDKVLKTYGAVLTTAAPVVNQISGSGNLGTIPVTPEITMVSITAAATAVLPVARTGQRKIIFLKAATAGTLEVTINAAPAAPVKITFAAAGNSAELIFLATGTGVGTGWGVVSLNGATAA